ncbi:MAG: hypothetical protein K2N29_01625 [Ruminiclostridium sp.]|nr:hypothetical protein [Ruminiclostridium sp.]
MQEVMKWECYIEEYRNEQGNLSARLRDKKTNKKVSIGGDHANKGHLLRFLSQAKINQNIMPTVFDKDGSDIVAVRGYLFSEDDTDILVNIDVETGGYTFE